jgi:hypothetical protein
LFSSNAISTPCAVAFIINSLFTLLQLYNVLFVTKPIAVTVPKCCSNLLEERLKGQIEGRVAIVGTQQSALNVITGNP